MTDSSRLRSTRKKTDTAERETMGEVKLDVAPWLLIRVNIEEVELEGIYKHALH